MAAFANGVSRVLGKVNINPVLKFLGPSVVLVNVSQFFQTQILSFTDMDLHWD